MFVECIGTPPLEGAGAPWCGSRWFQPCRSTVHQDHRRHVFPEAGEAFGGPGAAVPRQVGQSDNCQAAVSRGRCLTSAREVRRARSNAINPRSIATVDCHRPSSCSGSCLRFLPAEPQVRIIFSIHVYFLPSNSTLPSFSIGIQPSVRTACSPSPEPFRPRLGVRSFLPSWRSRRGSSWHALRESGTLRSTVRCESG